MRADTAVASRRGAQRGSEVRRGAGPEAVPGAVFREGIEWSPGDTFYRTGPHTPPNGGLLQDIPQTPPDAH
ncbi:hypothetical protein GCM10027440_36150 [Nocardiopsis coralliicola]